MCGRYALSLASGTVRSRVQDQFQSSAVSWDDEQDYNGPERGYNIAPRTRNPVVVMRANVNNDAGNALVMEQMQWGLLPHWLKRQPDYSGMLKTINARDDTIMEGGSMWKSIRGRKRCVVLAEGFFEWLKKSPTDKVPHIVKPKGDKLMCIAGLWDSVTFEDNGAEGDKPTPLHTYTIITTNSNKQLEFLHDRMPVILTSPEDIRLWLDTSSQEWTPELAKLLKPYEQSLECYPVPKEVGKVGQQSSDFLKPVSERKGNISSFFAKQVDKGKSSPTKTDKNMEAPSSSSNSEKAEDVEERKIEEQAADIPLNPDEGDDLKKDDEESGSPALEIIDEKKKPRSRNSDKETADERGSTEKSRSPRQKSKKGKAAKPDKGEKPSQPIVLDGSGEDEDEVEVVKESATKSQSTDKKKRKPTSQGEGSSKRKKTKQSSPKSKSKSPEKDPVDEQGNERLTNYFEVLSD